MRTLMFFVIALCAVSCGETTERVVEESYNENTPKRVVYYSNQDDNRVRVSEEKYYESGQIEFKGTYDKEGNRHGTWKYYYDTGELWSLGEYEHGLMNGKKEVYWPNGNLRYNGTFKNDEKSGKWSFYSQDGTLDKSLTFD